MSNKLPVDNPVFLIGSFAAAACGGAMVASVLALASFPATDDPRHIAAIERQCADQHVVSAIVQDCVADRLQHERETFWPMVKGIGFAGAVGGMLGGGVALSAMTAQRRRPPQP